MNALLVAALLLGCPKPEAAPEAPEAAAPTEAKLAETDKGAALAPEAPMTAPVNPESAGAALKEGGNCLDECMQKHMAEARDGDDIAKDCEAECGGGEPMSIDASKVPLSMGKRVRITGKLVRADYPVPLEGETEQATALELEGGTQVFVSTGAPPHGWDGLVGQEISVAGTLTPGETGGKRMMVFFLDDVDGPQPKP